MANAAQVSTRHYRREERRLRFLCARLRSLLSAAENKDQSGALALTPPE